MHADLGPDDLPALYAPDDGDDGERRPKPSQPPPKPDAAKPPDKWAWLVLDDRGLRVEPKAA